MGQALIVHPKFLCHFTDITFLVPQFFSGITPPRSFGLVNSICFDDLERDHVIHSKGLIPPRYELICAVKAADVKMKPVPITVTTNLVNNGG